MIGKKIKFQDSDDEDSASTENDDSSEDESDSKMDTLKGMPVVYVFSIELLSHYLVQHMLGHTILFSQLKYLSKCIKLHVYFFQIT